MLYARRAVVIALLVAAGLALVMSAPIHARVMALFADAEAWLETSGAN